MLKDVLYYHADYEHSDMGQAILNLPDMLQAHDFTHTNPYFFWDLAMKRLFKILADSQGRGLLLPGESTITNTVSDPAAVCELVFVLLYC